MPPFRLVQRRSRQWDSHPAARPTAPVDTTRGAPWPPSPPPARHRPSSATRSSPCTDGPSRRCRAAPNSNFRAWGEDTVYVDRGKGGIVWDIDGNEYVDLRMGYGPVILGHGDDRVDDYVNERMRRGVSFSLTSEDEVRALELVTRADRLGRQGPHDGLGHGGHDARDARRAGLHRSRQDREVRGPVPRRPRLRADQRRPQRHGRSRRRRQPGRASTWGRGIPGPVADTIIPARYNDIERLRALFERDGEEIAAIIVEPVLGNAQGIMPSSGLPRGDAGPDRGVRASC